MIIIFSVRCIVTQQVRTLISRVHRKCTSTTRVKNTYKDYKNLQMLEIIQLNCNRNIVNAGKSSANLFKKLKCQPSKCFIK